VAERVKETLPVQTRISLLKYLTDGAPGMVRGDQVEVITRSWGSVIGGWIASDRWGVLVEAGPNGIESVPLDQIRTVKRLQPADNPWPGCWCVSDCSACGEITICSMTRSRGMQA